MPVPEQPGGPAVVLVLGARESRSDQDYLDALRQAGLATTVLRPGGDAAGLIAAAQALVLAGGADIEPAQYGGPPHAEVEHTDPDRDRLERVALDQAAAAGVPVLAICRGMQMLNVHLGGRLIQHLPDVVGHDRHRDPAGPGQKHRAVHRVVLTEGRVRSALGTDVAEVNSRHHQAVDPDHLGVGLIVTGKSPDDGGIEAVELAGGRWVAGVQWHPENMAIGPAGPGREQARALFEALAREAGRQHPR